MLYYVDTSALLKRVLAEPESRALVSWLRDQVGQGSAEIATSSLTWVETSRAIRSAQIRRQGSTDLLDDTVAIAAEVALSGVSEALIGSDVIGLARRLGPPELRSLDAIHLATALLLDADALVAYDNRLLTAASVNNLRALSPA